MWDYHSTSERRDQAELLRWIWAIPTKKKMKREVKKSSRCFRQWLESVDRTNRSIDTGSRCVAPTSRIILTSMQRWNVQNLYFIAILFDVCSVLSHDTQGKQKLQHQPKSSSLYSSIFIRIFFGLIATMWLFALAKLARHGSACESRRFFNLINSWTS